MITGYQIYSIAATRIQACWRGYRDRKCRVIPTLRRIYSLRESLNHLLSEFDQDEIIAQVDASETYEAQLTIYEERAMQIIDGADEITTQGHPLLRQRRKQLVQDCESQILRDRVDAKRLKFQACKLEEMQRALDRKNQEIRALLEKLQE